jgi:iron complex outermembrane recepter protein
MPCFHYLPKHITQTALAMAVASLTFGPSAVAQQDAGAQHRLEEVIVTARRAEESLQSTPVAVTAFSNETLEMSQILDVAGLQRSAPNLTISTGAPATPGFANITMRGQTNMNANTASDPAIGLYLDGVYIARSAGSLLDLEDVKRVEVLRGPQGTLFGRSTVGGAISIVTEQPVDTFEAYVSGEAGNYDMYKVSGMVNAPLVDDRLAARVFYRYTEHDGYADNKTIDQDQNDMQDNNFARGHIKYTDPSDKWDLTLSGDYNKFKTSGQAIALAGVNPIAPFAPIPGLVESLQQLVQTSSNFYDSYGSNSTSAYPGFYLHEKFKQWGTSATLNVQFGGVLMESITAYRELDTFGSNDLDGTPADILYSLTSYQQDQFSQEFKFSGEFGDDFSWTAGAYYFEEKGTESSIAWAFGLFGQPVFENLGDIDSSSEALYGQVNYDFTDKLRLTAGYRQTWDDRKAVIKNTNPYLPEPVCIVPPDERDDGVTCKQSLSTDFDYPAWLVSLDYQLNDNIFLYTSASAASMSGGWNLRIGSAPAFKPEDNKAIEVGVKADWFDDRLRTNLAIFQSKPEDVQRVLNTVIDVGLGPQSTAFVQNAGDAEIYGAELEVTALPWEGMTLVAAVGYTDADYDSYEELQRVNVPTDPTGCTPAPDAGTGRTPPGAVDCVVDRSGEPYAATPEWTFSLGATQTIATRIGDLTLHADYSYIDEQVFSPSTAATQQPAAVQQAYKEANRYNTMDSRSVLNAKIDLDLLGNGWSFSIWGRNLTEEEYVSRAQDFYTGLGVATNFMGDPRTYGATVTYRFGG